MYEIDVLLDYYNCTDEDIDHALSQLVNNEISSIRIINISSSTFENDYGQKYNIQIIYEGDEGEFPWDGTLSYQNHLLDLVGTNMYGCVDITPHKPRVKVDRTKALALKGLDILEQCEEQWR